MGLNYSHICGDERQLIWRLRKKGMGVREISRELRRTPSTISRELTRNEYHRESQPQKCHYKSVIRRRESYRKPRLKSKQLQQEVVRRLQLGHSPEQISGRLKVEGSEQCVCHESIYQFIYAQRPDLRACLCRKHGLRKRFRQSKKTKRLAPIPQRISISERPKHIELRQEIGHWESDLAISKKSFPALEILVERKTRFSLIRKTKNKSGREIARVIIDAFKETPSQLVKTLTFDNGAENAGHRAVNYELETSSYFCDPYHAWQKGTVENTVGIIRRTFPKGTDFASIPDTVIAELECSLNNRPRKCLGFKTPAESMAYEIVALQT